MYAAPTIHYYRFLLFHPFPVSEGTNNDASTLHLHRYDNKLFSNPANTSSKMSSPREEKKSQTPKQISACRNWKDGTASILLFFNQPHSISHHQSIYKILPSVEEKGGKFCERLCSRRLLNQKSHRLRVLGEICYRVARLLL